MNFEIIGIREKREYLQRAIDYFASQTIASISFCTFLVRELKIRR